MGTECKLPELGKALGGKHVPNIPSNSLRKIKK